MLSNADLLWRRHYPLSQLLWRYRPWKIAPEGCDKRVGTVVYGCFFFTAAAVVFFLYLYPLPAVTNCDIVVALRICTGRCEKYQVQRKTTARLSIPFVDTNELVLFGICSSTFNTPPNPLSYPRLRTKPPRHTSTLSLLRKRSNYIFNIFQLYFQHILIVECTSCTIQFCVAVWGYVETTGMFLSGTLDVSPDT